MKQRLIILSLLLLAVSGLFHLFNGDERGDASESSVTKPDNFSAELLPFSGSSPSSPQSPKANTQHWRDKADELLQCAQSESCNFPKTDPKSYS